ncbi:hypothetical protein BC629DRAFT_1549203 [Irpex lacteus]|nr:hypothetical protein BC629DRAFT_1549203 [Irpex lacteus]
MLNEQKTFRAQDPECVKVIKGRTAAQFPILNKFDNQWPAIDLLRSVFEQHRRDLHRKKLLDAVPRQYRTTHEQRSHQGKEANAASQAARRARQLETDEVRTREAQEADNDDDNNNNEEQAMQE